MQPHSAFTFNTLPSLPATSVFKLFMILYFALKLTFIFSGTDLFTEEAQYWLWSRYPDWSYYSKPPLIAWINYLTDVFPPSDIVIRFTALLFGAATLIVHYRLSLLVFGSTRIARLSVVILSVSPYFVLASTFFTTDSLLIFFWLLSFYLLFAAIKDSNINRWILVGLALGLGCLSKYAMFFIMFVTIPLWRTKQVHVIRGLLVAFAIELFSFIPVVIWNYQHDWVTFKHVSGLAMPRNEVTLQSSIRYILEYCGGIILINSPFLLLLFADPGFRTALFRNNSQTEKTNLSILAFPMIATMTVFLLVSVFKRTEVNWPSVTYTSLPLIVAFGVDRAQLHIKALIYSSITLVVVALLLFPTSLDKMKMSELLPVKRDSMKRFAGWSYLADEVGKLQNADVKISWLLTDSYHVASELAFYTRQSNVLCINLGRRMNQLDIWFMNRTDLPRAISALYVTEATTIHPSMSFDSLTGHYVIPILYRGHVVKKFHVYRLSDMRLNQGTFTSY